MLGQRFRLKLFLSTPSARRATIQQTPPARIPAISIHALREEGDWFGWPSRWSPPDFYPRPPRGGRRCNARCNIRCNTISIHALREEGDAEANDQDASRCISIHALREEGDPTRVG